MQISKEDYETAESNGIPRTTVYNRVVNRGWSVEAAIATPADHKKESLRKKSKLYGLKRGKARTIKMPIEYDEKLNQLISQSGLTEMDFLAEIIIDYLNS